MIDRRDAIGRLSLLLGGALSPQIAAALMGQATNTGPSIEPSDGQVSLLAEVADVIIPETGTPGAKAAGAHEFAVRVVRDCFELEEQEEFYAGLARIEAASQEAHGKGFAELEAGEKAALVDEARRSDGAFFRQVRQLTVTGYFTSEIGATQALEYLPIPGRFEGDVPMQPGQKTWAL